MSDMLVFNSNHSSGAHHCQRRCWSFIDAYSSFWDCCRLYRYSISFQKKAHEVLMGIICILANAVFLNCCTYIGVGGVSGGLFFSPASSVELGFTELLFLFCLVSSMTMVKPIH